MITGLFRVISSVIVAVLWRGGKTQRSPEKPEVSQYQQRDSHDIGVHLSRFIQLVHASGRKGPSDDGLLQALTLLEEAVPPDQVDDISYPLNESQTQGVLEFIQGVAICPVRR